MSWPLVLLLASIVATGVALVEAQRLARSHRATARKMVEDYTAIAAWNYQRFAAAAFHDAIVGVLAPVMHFQMHGQLHIGRPTHPQWFVNHFLDRRSPHYADISTPFPEIVPPTFFGFVLGTDTILSAGAPVDGREARALLDTLGVHVRRVHDRAWDVGLVSLREDAGGRLFAYTLMPTTLGDTAVYAIPLDADRYGAVFRQVYDHAELLPSSLLDGRRANEIVDIAVVDARRRPLFQSGSRPHLSVHGQEAFAPQFGGLDVVATVRGDAAGQLIIGGLPASRLPFLLALLGIAAALALVGVGQLRRESALATLRSDFVANVSHELRTPLAQMRLFLETFRLGRFSTRDQREWLLDSIDRETARLSNLVENLLLFSRLEHGRSRALPEPVELADEIRRIVQDFEPLAASRRVRLRSDLRVGVIAAVQRGPFRQLLLNLLDNAIKYGPPGQTVTVRLTSAQDAIGRVARIAVQDMGPGVPLADRTRIWKPFQRGSEAPANASAGGGIGLAIVQEVAEQHGGRAWVEDGAAGGAVFMVELPADAAAADASGPAEPPRTAAIAS